VLLEVHDFFLALEMAPFRNELTRVLSEGNEGNVENNGMLPHVKVLHRCTTGQGKRRGPQSGWQSVETG